MVGGTPGEVRPTGQPTAVAAQTREAGTVTCKSMQWEIFFSVGLLWADEGNFDNVDLIKYIIHRAVETLAKCAVHRVQKCKL